MTTARRGKPLFASLVSAAGTPTFAGVAPDDAVCFASGAPRPPSATGPGTDDCATAGDCIGGKGSMVADCVGFSAVVGGLRSIVAAVGGGGVKSIVAASFGGLRSMLVAVLGAVC